MQKNTNAVAAAILLFTIVGGFLYLRGGNNSPEPKIDASINPNLPSTPNNNVNLTTDAEVTQTLIAKFTDLESQISKQDNTIRKLRLQLNSENNVSANTSTTPVDSEGEDESLRLKIESHITEQNNKLQAQLNEAIRNLNNITKTNKQTDTVDLGYNPKNPPITIDGGGTKAQTPVLQTPETFPPVIIPNLFETSNVQHDGWNLPLDANVIQDGKVQRVVFAVNQNQIAHSSTAKNRLQTTSLDHKDSDPITEIPVITIPQEATLTNATTMTALLGRIPVAGKLTDPWEFKLLVGRENLAANGLYVNGLDRMIMRGVAKGDYTGKCVSGDIVAATFVFTDGKIRTINARDFGGTQSDYQSAGSITQNRIGWLSTPGGIPCLTGEYISDAPKFIATQGGLATLGAISQGYAAAATSTTGSGDDKEFNINNQSQYALGQGGTAMTNTLSDWVNEIKESAYAMIYVPSNQPVAVHITEELRIDYETDGRFLQYDQADWHNASYLD